ncbi:MAG: hypothetical protein DME18_11795 [Verrucomicrobia bacterium]|nr:MAG: hypothetical protein DME18_11795 [Verrucomicrobiota bacterium]
MNHLTEEQLILHHYGEAEGRGLIASHLQVCESCRTRYQALQRVIEAVNTLTVPPRAENYGAEIWRQLCPRIARTAAARRSDLWRLFQWPRWALAGGLALLVLAAFVAGRFWPQRGLTTGPLTETSRRPISRQARERVLLKEIGDHLERSQLALIELINSKTNGVVDISLEQSLARQLVDVNRLYRQTAARLGDAGMASVLEDLERTLIEISNSPSKLSSTELAEFRRRIDTDDTLFKIKVVSSQVRARERDAARELAGKRS